MHVLTKTVVLIGGALLALPPRSPQRPLPSQGSTCEEPRSARSSWTTRVPPTWPAG